MLHESGWELRLRFKPLQANGAVSFRLYAGKFPKAIWISHCDNTQSKAKEGENHGCFEIVRTSYPSAVRCRNSFCHCCLCLRVLIQGWRYLLQPYRRRLHSEYRRLMHLPMSLSWPLKAKLPGISTGNMQIAMK